ncbi:MAG: ABC transporter permease [Chthoniobacterales bacterium]
MHDIRFAFRQLLKSPGFTLLTVLTLAIGIGMNTAIFSLMNDIFLRGLNFKEPDRLVVIQAEAKERNLEQLPMSVPRFWQYRDGQTVFSEFGVDAGNGYILTGLGDPVQLFGANVTANYFDLLGIKTIRGRNFLPEEEMSADVALVTENFWKKRLGSDPNAIGRAVNLNGVATTIVGIIPNMPLAWFGPNSEVFTVKPFQLTGLTKDRLMRGVSFMRAVGRIKQGVTIDQVRAQMPALQASYKEKFPENADNTWAPVVRTAADTSTGNLRPAFFTLLAAVGAVLLIACSNVANLLLVRFTGRRREIALRMALGASRQGVVRLFVLESMVVSLIAGLAGLLLALWIVSIVPKLALDNLPIASGGISLNTPVLLFTLGISLLTGLAMGCYPAWQSSRADLVDGLKDGGRAMQGSRGQQRFRRGLVATQVGLSVVLLAGAALLITSFLRLSRQDAGFRFDHTWVGAVGMPEAAYPDNAARARFVERLQNELQNSAGVEAVAIADGVPLGGNNSSSPYARVDGNPPPVNQRPLGKNNSIAPGYMKTFGIPLLAGRDFDERDGLDKPPVVLISKSAAKKLFPGEDPVGKQMYFGTDNGTGLVTEVVGVVGDVRSLRLDKANDVEFYRPWPQRTAPFCNVVVRTPMKPESAGAIVRAALNRVDPQLPIIQPQTMEAVVNQSLGQQRLTMSLLGAFAAVAMVLAAVGIYGAVAYTVEQRTGEIGVRMALGAQTMDVLRLVVSQGMMPVIIGLVLGLAGAFAMGRLLTAQLYQVSAGNPALLAGTAVMLAAVGLFACFMPARRATLVNPIQALRTE